jgi:hypothetical protein
VSFGRQGEASAEVLTMESQHFLEFYHRIDRAMTSRRPEPFLSFLTSNFRLFLPNGQIRSYAQYAEWWTTNKLLGNTHVSYLDYSVTRTHRLENDLFEVTLETSGLIEFNGDCCRIESQCFDTWVETLRGWCIETRIKTRDLFLPSTDLFGRAALSLGHPTETLLPLAETESESIQPARSVSLTAR